jgi:hypothetical protein
MEKEKTPPRSFRANEQDQAIFTYLQKRLGLEFPQIIRLAIRRLYEQEKRVEKK